MSKKIIISLFLFACLFGIVPRAKAVTVVSDSYDPMISELAALRREILSMIIGLVNSYAAQTGTTTINGISYSTSSLKTLSDSAARGIKFSTTSPSFRNIASLTDGQDNSNAGTNNSSGNNTGQNKNPNGSSNNSGNNTGSSGGQAGSQPSGGGDTGSAGGDTGSAGGSGTTGFDQNYIPLAGRYDNSNLSSDTPPSDPGDSCVKAKKAAAAKPVLKNYYLRGTAYSPRSAEGGANDRAGCKIYTLEDFLSGGSKFVTTAVHKNMFKYLPYGTYIRIPELEKGYNGGKVIWFMTNDTGVPSPQIIDIAVRNPRTQTDSRINRKLTLIPVEDSK